MCDFELEEMIQFGSFEEVTEYLEIGNRLDYEDDDSNNILLLASYFGRKDVLIWLLEEKHFDISYRTFTGENVLFLAACGGNIDILEYLVDEKEQSLLCRSNCESTLLLEACHGGNIPTIEWLLNRNASINEVADNGCNSIMTAVYSSNINVISWLIENTKCDINHIDNNGRTALEIAVSNNNLKIAKYLIEQGASTKSICTPIKGHSLPTLFELAKNGKIEIIAYLVQQNLEIDETELLQYIELSGKEKEFLHLLNQNRQKKAIKYQE